MFFLRGIPKGSALPSITPSLLCVPVLRNLELFDGHLSVNVPILGSDEHNPQDQIFPALLQRFFLPTQRKFVGELRSFAG